MIVQPQTIITKRGINLMNIITQILANMEKNIKENIKIYHLSDILTANSLYNFDNYIQMVNCIDDISCDFSTFLYSSFIEQIDNAFFHSDYRKKWCTVINIFDRNIITLFGEVSFKRRYYYDRLKHKNYYFVDHVLNIKPYSRFDPFVCAKICEVASHDSYAKAGRTVSELIGKRLKFNDNPDKILINRAEARNIVLHFLIPDIKYDFRPTHKKLYVMLDEKWVHSQYNNGKDFMVKAAVVFENVEKVYKHSTKKRKIRYKLIGKHVLASIDNDLKEQVDEYIFNSYDTDQIDEIVFMGDCASWITAFPKDFKYHKDMKITFSIDGFHFSNALQNICTQKYEDLFPILKQACFDNDKDLFITLCDSLIKLEPFREDTIIDKRDYILNNWNYVQVYFHKNSMRCCMESNISHCFADIFTSRPRAYSERGLRQLLKLRLLKLNNVDIQKTYFDVINKKFDNNFLFNCNWSFEPFDKKNYPIAPTWLNNLDMVKYNHFFS